MELLVGLVVGWFWMGSFWGCLLYWIRGSRVNRNDWGAYVALLMPTQMVWCVNSNKNWPGHELTILPAWFWPLLGLVFDFVLLTWGREVRRRYWYAILIGFTAIGILGMTTSSRKSATDLAAFVGVVIVTSLVLLRKNAAAVRPPATSFDLRV